MDTGGAMCHLALLGSSASLISHAKFYEVRDFILLPFLYSPAQNRAWNISRHSIKYLLNE